jgi:hypothetical protein
MGFYANAFGGGGAYYASPPPIPLRQGPFTPGMGKKLAFFRGPHLAFEAQRDVVPNTDRLARSDQDNTYWAGAYEGFVNYPREISANNRESPPFASADSITKWSPETGVVGVKPVTSRRMNANFFASDPQQFGSVGGGFLSGMSGGGGVDYETGMMPAGAWSFLTPGTLVVRPVYRQNYYGPVNPTMTTKDLQTSSIYNPLPAFGTVVPRLP